MIVIVAGVSGSGKSTIGALLAGQLGWRFEDGDELHPAGNIAKMEAGVPLTDEDRRPWLDAVAAWIDQRSAAGGSGVIACSALKRSYRDRLRDGRPELLDSQLADAEAPLPAEPAIVVDANGPPSDVVREIIRRLGLGLS